MNGELTFRPRAVAPGGDWTGRGRREIPRRNAGLRERLARRVAGLLLAGESASAPPRLVEPPPVPHLTVETSSDAERTRDELLSALVELDASRRSSAADAERFREGLAAVRAFAEDAVAVEQQAAEELRVGLRAANEQVAAAHDRADRLQAALARSEAERERVEAELRSQIGRMRWQTRGRRRLAVGALALCVVDEAVLLWILLTTNW